MIWKFPILTAAAISLFMFQSPAARADYLSPFADLPAGKTVCSEGWIIQMAERPEEKYGVVFNTDTGLRLLPAVSDDKELFTGHLGTPSGITARIDDVDGRRILALQSVQKSACGKQ